MEKFFDYFDGRYRESILKKAPADDGPVITISRLTGCDARQVAAILADNLNQKFGTTNGNGLIKILSMQLQKN